MVQEYVSPIRVHKYPFEMVMAAYERRFPSCPEIPVVIECVITEDSWSADGSQRHTTRRCQLNVDAPYLLKKMIGVDYVYFIQKNQLDLKSRVLEIEATNETFASRVGVVEKCRYYVHPENAEWTCFEQIALLDVKNFFGFEERIEKIAMKQYAANIAKGKELIESFMEQVMADGVRDLPPWSEKDPEYNRVLRKVVSRGAEPTSPKAVSDARCHSQPGTSLRNLPQLLEQPSLLTSEPKRSLASTASSALRKVSNRIKSETLIRAQSLKRLNRTSTNDVARSKSIDRLVEKKRSGDVTPRDVTNSSIDLDNMPRKKSSGTLSKVKFQPLPDAMGHHDLTRSSNDVLRRRDVKVPRISNSSSSLTAISRDLVAEDSLEDIQRRMSSLRPLRVSYMDAQVSAPDQYTLDSEYIKRYLGELSPIQESRLMQLRKWIADLQKGKVPSDTTLLRFLRARDFNVEKAREMLSQSLLWRKKHQVDRLLAEYETPDVVSQYFPGGWHHHDKDGRPLYVLRLGQMDVKGLLKSIGEDGLLKLTLHVCEEGLKLLEEATRASNTPIASWCMLVDLDGLNMRHLWRPGVRALLRIIQIVEANYPETMGRVLIVRAPRVFPILWTIVSTFIDENTRSKFLFYGGKDYLQPGGLLDYIPKDLIPDFLGGPCKSFVHEGGLVPKSLYVSGAFTEREGDPLCEDSIYRSVSLGKGQIHEVIVVNKDPQSVLTWDFDVLRHDIAFTVFRADRELRAAPRDCASSLCVGAADEGSVLQQKGWREGEHYQRVEPTLICHDGESIQGSHVMAQTGSYVLQWASEMLDSSHRAAQLMYFHETLDSHQYKGSMSSLQSGTSGFSCLSGKSGISSCPSR